MQKEKTKNLKGIAISEGIAIGKVYIFRNTETDEFGAPVPVVSQSVEVEKERFSSAVERTAQQIQKIQSDYAMHAGVKMAKIFDAHLLLLEDVMLIGQVNADIASKNISAEVALEEVSTHFFEVFNNIPDKYLGERIGDIRDVLKRLADNLAGTNRLSLDKLNQNSIIIAHDLSPSDTASMLKDKVLGIVTEIGGPTSHTAIMARALEVPAATDFEGLLDELHDGDEIILDGNKGEIIINPSPELMVEYSQLQSVFLQKKADLIVLKNKPAVTLSGQIIGLHANIETPEEVDFALARGAEGVGLYRTEYLFMNRKNLPDEEEQYAAYSYVAKKCGDRPVVIRSLDLGGDKFVSSLNLPREMNPFMGWRAIRFCLEHTEIFKVQLRAIARASSYGNVKTMFPMVSTIEEFRQARVLVREVQKELIQEGYDVDLEMPVGMMIEIPSAAVIADFLAQEVDFFSIGTNDLIQYTLAIDRVNIKTAKMYDPFNLSVLRMLKMTIGAAHNDDDQLWDTNKVARKSIPVSVCGEAAAMPAMICLLAGMKVDTLSMSATSLLKSKEIIRGLDSQRAEILAHEALRRTDSKVIRTRIEKEISNLI